MDDDSEIERRVSASEIREIASNVYDLNTRMVVLETRMNTYAHQLIVIEADGRETKKGINDVHNQLMIYAQEEAARLNRLLVWVISTLLSVLGLAATLFITHLLGKL